MVLWGNAREISSKILVVPHSHLFALQKMSCRCPSPHKMNYIHYGYFVKSKNRCFSWVFIFNDWLLTAHMGKLQKSPVCVLSTVQSVPNEPHMQL